MKKYIFRWSIYAMMFGLLLSPLMVHYGLTSFLEIISISFSVGFFAGLLNEISSELKSINNKLENNERKN
jgi:uncharacterized membrane protein